MEDDMSVLATDKRQLTLIYNSETSLGKQTVGYVESSGDKIQMVDISKTSLGDTVWVSLAEGLNKPFGELLATDHPDAPEIDGGNFSTDDWLKLIKKNPVLLQQPIAVNGDNYMQVDTPSEILKFFDVDSAGLSKKPLGQQPNTDANDEEPFV
ncbi:arsenate reductase family protein [Zeaxanthinibacter enoshimensis]|uniref:Arsenate reductase-like glutaredoxin family protein n=1 Tax=Zeaxanthinibacter enoshimensis TaxID=392009 RepID=A0A4R6TP32_9FLAO|nr:hypothetical protein [Zeaxanthinibacter enoshimensis]TDQ31355.1 arsenate reductase-like glutaredoxin family protein [Zeaxanthinibacter enoshimensis]